MLLYKDLLRYKQYCLGFAMLWIISSHCPYFLGPLDFIQAIGYGGVDIFLFASGIGCFFSLSRDADVLNFIKRRIKRLAPTYMIFIIIWLIYEGINGNCNFQMIIGNLLAVQPLTGSDNYFNWYISAIFLFYILAPYLKLIAERSKPIFKFLFLLFLFALSIPFWNAHSYIITITRLPIFYMGMLFADFCKKDIKIRWKHVFVLAVAFIIGTGLLMLFRSHASETNMWEYGLHWYPFILITPPLCFAVSYVSKFLEGKKVFKPVLWFLSLCSEYSFEIYLLHLFLISVIHSVIGLFNLSEFSYLVWPAGVVALCISCFVIRRFSIWITKCFLKK